MPIFKGKSASLRCKAEGDATRVDVSCGDRQLCRLTAGFGVLRLSCGDDEAALFVGCQSAPRLPRGVADRLVVYD